MPIRNSLKACSLQAKGLIHDALQHYAGPPQSTLVSRGPSSMPASPSYLVPKRSVHAGRFVRVPTERCPGPSPATSAPLLDHLAAVRVEDWEASHRAMRAAATLAPREYSLSFAISAIGRNHLPRSCRCTHASGLDAFTAGTSRATANYSRYRCICWTSTGTSWTMLAALVKMRRRARGAVQELAALPPSVASPQSGAPGYAARASAGRLVHASSRIEKLATELRAHGHAPRGLAVLARGNKAARVAPAQERRHRNDVSNWPTPLPRVAIRRRRYAYYRLVRDYPTSRGYPDNVLLPGISRMIAARRGDSIRRGNSRCG